MLGNEHDYLDNIVDSYDVLLLDVWGVIQDGLAPLGNAIETLCSIHERGRSIILISNTPSRAFVLQQELASIGFDVSLFAHIVTAGEVVFQALCDVNNLAIGQFGKKYFYIGPSARRSLLQGSDYIMVDRLELADFLLLAGFNDNEAELSDYSATFSEAHCLKIPLLCASPDQFIVQSKHTVIPCAGLLAENYEKLGGRVEYFGKPYGYIYDYIKNITRGLGRVVAIGDSLLTDVAGANSAGFDSVLLLSGVENINCQRLEIGIEERTSTLNIHPWGILRNFEFEKREICL